MADKKASAKRAPVDRAARFRKLATKRTNRAITAIGRLSNLADRRGYVYTPEQAAKIVAALETAVAAVRARFEQPQAPDTASFTL